MRHLNLIGESAGFQEVLRLVRRLSQCDATVLIEGETGTGKELVARALHYLGNRRTAPFIAVNCGAIPDSLVESEFFGHTSGAFTDAKQARAGVVAQAQGGTLFLDEVDSLSARSQVSLLRFLQDYEYRPVGGSASKSANVRVVAASNADLEQLVAAGSYRRDLLYRLNVLSVHLPPLRERGDDVRLLAEAFLRRLSIRHATAPRTLHPDTLAFFRSHPWPGNVRELENLIQRDFLLSDGDQIRISATAGSVAEVSNGASQPLTKHSFQQAKARAIAQFERAYIGELLERTRGNVSMAARLCGKERSRLGKLLKKYGLDRADFCRGG
ncbi:MAG: AAA family ATPase [Betaproteobacteria bacterium]|nr:AAA family ATPase [Betaproteobacteria bacterium]